MRPAAFHSLSVLRCVRQSRRLWIWIRSSRRARSRLSDCSICATPALRPLVHTFVARNSLSVIASSRARSPTTDSAAPYIGDESTTRPPSSTRLLSTSRSGARSASPPPTSNTRHVPNPTAGIVSPLAGMGRLSIWGAAPAPPGSAAAAAIRRSTRRRVICAAGLSLALPLIPAPPHITEISRPPNRQPRGTFARPASSELLRRCPMKKLIAALAMVALAASPVFAAPMGHDGFHGAPHSPDGHPGGFEHHGPDGHREFPRDVHGHVFIGVDPWFYWAAPPAYAYAPPPSYWYYCPSAGAYYPYVASCPEPWVPVPTAVQ